MFNNLLESKAVKQRSVGGTVVSIVTHALLIAGAVYATAQATVVNEKPKQEEVKFVETPKNEPPPPEPEAPPPPPDIVAAPPPPQGFQVLTAPVKIPDVIPDIDLTKQVTNEADFSGKGVAGGIAKGVVGGTAVVDNSQPFFEFQVEKIAVEASCPQPRYPPILQSAGVEGEVLAQFTVDKAGRAEMASFKSLSPGANPLFITAIRNALPGCRFIPAEAGGVKVRQVVQKPYQFTVPK